MNYLASIRLLDQLKGNQIDDNCVVYIVHQFLFDNCAESGSNGQTKDDSITDFVKLAINTLANSSTGEDKSRKH